VVGDTGYYVPYGDEKATAEVIRKAFSSDKGDKARERVESLFASNMREAELIEAIRIATG
jgi:hypothetical protein